MRRLLPLSIFAFLFLAAIPVYAEATPQDVSFTGSSLSQGIFGLEGEVPFASTVDNVKAQWLELMRFNYVGQGAREVCHYGPRARYFLGAFASDALDSAESAGVSTVAMRAFQKRTESLEIVRSGSVELKVRAEGRGRTGLSIQLLF